MLKSLLFPYSYRDRCSHLKISIIMEMLVVTNEGLIICHFELRDSKEFEFTQLGFKCSF